MTELEKIDLSVIIPTYRREEVLVDTLRALVGLNSGAAEIIVVDQTPRHDAAVTAQLENWQRSGTIRWLQQPNPSIPVAMNRGALAARGETLLFLDDDVVPEPGLLKSHVQAHRDKRGDLIVGKVLQPWHDDSENSVKFTHDQGHEENEFIGCNFSISRQMLFRFGGFDENFKGVAYRYELEFSDRFLQGGGVIWYEPAAAVRHLHAGSGGTRSEGDHLTSWNPRHPVGAYYYLLRSDRVRGRGRQVFARFFGSVATRHHLRKPWYIPVTLCSELTGLAWAAWLAFRAAKLPLRPGMESSWP